MSALKGDTVIVTFYGEGVIGSASVLQVCPNSNNLEVELSVSATNNLGLRLADVTTKEEKLKLDIKAATDASEFTRIRELTKSLEALRPWRGLGALRDLAGSEAVIILPRRFCDPQAGTGFRLALAKSGTYQVCDLCKRRGVATSRRMLNLARESLPEEPMVCRAQPVPSLPQPARRPIS